MSDHSHSGSNSHQGQTDGGWLKASTISHIIDISYLGSPEAPAMESHSYQAPYQGFRHYFPEAREEPILSLEDGGFEQPRSAC